MPAQISFPLDAHEAFLLALYGLDDYICCYRGTFSQGEEPWREFVLEGAQALAEQLDRSTRAAVPYTLRGEEILLAYETLEDMQEDSPVDGLSLESRERIYALVERLGAAAATLRLHHWDRVLEETSVRDERALEIAEGRFRPSESGPPWRPSSLA